MTHELVFYVNEGPTATIDQAAGQDDPTGASPIEFSVVFSEAVTGFEAGDIDLSASTDTGPLSASVSGSGDTYTVSITGMTSGGLVVISVAKGAANAAAGGAVTEDSVSIDDSVLYIPQLAPSATNLVQNIGYEAGPVDLDDIVVTDPNDSVMIRPALIWTVFARRSSGTSSITAAVMSTCSYSEMAAASCARRA